MKIISIVIPVYNLEQKIKQNILILKQFCETNFKDKFEIIAVDDGSIDKTPKILSSLNSNNVQIILLPSNLGKGGAIKKGFEKSSGKYLFFIDADLPYDLEGVNSFITLFNDGYDMVIGSRNLPGSESKAIKNFGRTFLSKLFSKLANTVLLNKIEDTQCGLKAFSHDTGKNLFAKNTIHGFSFDVELLYNAQKANYKIALAPVTLVRNEVSSITFRHMLHMLSDVCRLIFRKYFQKN